MKQLLRYLLLIGCVLLPCLWSISIFRNILIGYGSTDAYGIRIWNGQIGWSYAKYGGFLYPGFIFSNKSNTYGNLTSLIKLGITIPYYNSFFKAYMIPIWMLLIPLSMITIYLWYPELKAWRAGTNRKGFEVETKDRG